MIMTIDVIIQEKCKWCIFGPLGKCVFQNQTNSNLEKMKLESSNENRIRLTESCFLIALGPGSQNHVS